MGLVIIKGGHGGAGAALTCERTGVSFMLKCGHRGVGAALRCEQTDKIMQEMAGGCGGLIDGLGRLRTQTKALKTSVK